MTAWPLVRIIAGCLILLSLALGIPASPIFVSPWWLAFTAFVGINLMQSGFTRFGPVQGGQDTPENGFTCAVDLPDLLAVDAQYGYQ